MRYLTLIIAITLLPICVTAQIGSVDILKINSSGNPNPRKLTAVGNQLFFVANDGVHGDELWSATVNGQPQRKTDIQQGSAHGIYALPNDHKPMAVLGQSIFFVGVRSTPPNASLGLYEYNIAQDKTTIIDTNVYATTASVSYNNKLYLSATRMHDKGIYEYDPNTKQLTLLHNQTAGAQDGAKNEMILIGDKIYYTTLISGAVANELHEYNISTKTNTVIIDHTAPKGLNVVHAYDIFKMGNSIGFIAYDNTAPEPSVFSYDGNLLKKLVANATISRDISGTLWCNTPLFDNGKIYYKHKEVASSAQVRKNALYRYDVGINAYAQIADSLVDIKYYGATKDLNPANYTIYNGRLFFSGNIPIVESSLCVFDNNKFAAYAIDLGGSNKKTQPKNFITLNSVLFFIAKTKDDLGYQLVRYNEFNISVNNIEKLITSTLYPNPTNGNATLNIALDKTQSIAITLTDISGRVVYTKAADSYNAGQHNITLPIHTLATGTYIYKLVDDKGTTISTGKLMKE